jgi:glutaredoxin 2
MSQPPVSVVYAATLSLLKKESSKFKVQSLSIINYHQQSSTAPLSDSAATQQKPLPLHH